jgi:hypothetical protein
LASYPKAFSLACLATPPKGCSLSTLSIKNFLKILCGDSTMPPKKCVTNKPSMGCKAPSKGPSPPNSPIPHNFSSTSPIPPSSVVISTPPPSPIPSSSSVTWSLQNKEAHKPLDITKIFGSPHKIPKDFKEWLPIFSWEDLIEPEDPLYLFLCSLESCDQNEDILMKLFSYTFVGREKDWFDNIPTGKITNWNLF